MTFVPVALKLALVTLFVLTVVASSVAVLLVRRANADVVRAKSVAAEMVADLFGASLAPALDFDDQDGVTAELSHLAQNQEVSYAGIWKGEAAEPIAELHADARKGAVRPTRNALVVADDHITVERLVQGPDKDVLGAVIVQFSLAREIARADQASRDIVVGALITGAGVFLLLIGAVRLQITGPLSRLASAVRGLERGRVERIGATERDEIGRLGVAFDRMAGAIADREARLANLAARQQELFDHMRQGIVVFGRDGQLDPLRSRSAELVFGEALHAGDVRRLLYGDEDSTPAAAFDEWLKVAFDVDGGAWDEVAELAPRRAVLRSGLSDEREVALEFRPILEDGKVERVMVLATDETDKARLLRQVARQEEDHARQMKAMRRLVAGGGQLLVTMIEASRRHLTSAREILSEIKDQVERAVVERLFQHVHTVKGEARALDLSLLETEAAAFEDRLAIFRGRLRGGESVAGPPAKAELGVLLDRLTTAVDGAAAMLVEASPVGAAILEQVTVRRADLERLIAATAGQNTQAAIEVQRLVARPFGESLLYLTDALPEWAAREGKQIDVAIEGRDVAVPRELARVLPGVLTHLTRNAVFHGIELPEERTQADKPSTGKIRIAASTGPAGPVVVVTDDGRGLDDDGLRRGAADAGVDSARAVAEIALESGVTTAMGGEALAGRGVGLAAVREELAEIGYAIALESSQGRGLTVKLSPTRKS